MTTKSMFSTVTSHIPFINYTDGNRVQMASSMIRQAQCLLNPEPPIISTWNSLIKFNSMFVQRAKDNGVVIHNDKNIIVVKYEDGSDDYFIKPNIPTFITSNKSVGDNIYKDEIIVWHKSYNKGLNQIMFGINANVAFMSYDGYTYEDAIVISSKCADKLRSYIIEKLEISIPSDKYHIELYQNISVGSKLKRGKVCRVSHIGKKLHNALYSSHTKDVINDNDFVITDIKVLYRDKKILEKALKLQSNDVVELINNYIIDSKQNILFKDNYDVEDAIRIIIQGYRIHDVEVGDKLANLWGNKGTISLIDNDIYLIDKYSNNKFPIDVVHTPVGVPARMNIAQVFYGYLGYFLKYVVPTIISEFKTDDDVLRFILGLYEYLDKNSYKKVMTILNSLDDESRKSFIKNSIADIKKNGLQLFISEYTHDIGKRILNLFREFDRPETMWSDRFNAEIGCGVIYTMKLEHMIYKKLDYHSIGSYNAKTLLPEDGQRVGEMEIWTLAAYNVENILLETLRIRSDDIASKTKALENITLFGEYSLKDLLHNNDNVADTETFKILKAYLKQMFVDIS